MSREATTLGSRSPSASLRAAIVTDVLKRSGEDIDVEKASLALADIRFSLGKLEAVRKQHQEAINAIGRASTQQRTWSRASSPGSRVWRCSYRAERAGGARRWAPPGQPLGRPSERRYFVFKKYLVPRVAPVLASSPVLLPIRSCT